MVRVDAAASKMCLRCAGTRRANAVQQQSRQVLLPPGAANEGKWRVCRISSRNWHMTCLSYAAHTKPSAVCRWQPAHRVVGWWLWKSVYERGEERSTWCRSFSSSS